MTLLRHFKNYLVAQQKKSEEEKQAAAVENDSENEPQLSLQPAVDLIFVKKWVRTRHAILFRISNRTVQVAFFDNTEIILSSGAKAVTYVDKEGKRKTCSLKKVMAANRPDIAKRLKYTKGKLKK